MSLIFIEYNCSYTNINDKFNCNISYINNLSIEQLCSILKYINQSDLNIGLEDTLKFLSYVKKVDLLNLDLDMIYLSSNKTKTINNHHILLSCIKYSTVYITLLNRFINLDKNKLKQILVNIKLYELQSNITKYTNLLDKQINLNKQFFISQDKIIHNTKKNNSIYSNNIIDLNKIKNSISHKDNGTILSKYNFVFSENLICINKNDIINLLPIINLSSSIDINKFVLYNLYKNRKYGVDLNFPKQLTKQNYRRIVLDKLFNIDLKNIKHINVWEQFTIYRYNYNISHDNIYNYIKDNKKVLLNKNLISTIADTKYIIKNRNKNISKLKYNITSLILTPYSQNNKNINLNQNLYANEIKFKNIYNINKDYLLQNIKSFFLDIPYLALFNIKCIDIMNIIPLEKIIYINMLWNNLSFYISKSFVNNEILNVEKTGDVSFNNDIGRLNLSDKSILNNELLYLYDENIKIYLPTIKNLNKDKSKIGKNTNVNCIDIESKNIDSYKSQVEIKKIETKLNEISDIINYSKTENKFCKLEDILEAYKINYNDLVMLKIVNATKTPFQTGLYKDIFELMKLNFFNVYENKLILNKNRNKELIFDKLNSIYKHNKIQISDYLTIEKINYIKLDDLFKTYLKSNIFSKDDSIKINIYNIKNKEINKNILKAFSNNDKSITFFKSIFFKKYWSNSQFKNKLCFTEKRNKKLIDCDSNLLIEKIINVHNLMENFIKTNISKNISVENFYETVDIRDRLSIENAFIDEKWLYNKKDTKVLKDMERVMIDPLFKDIAVYDGIFNKMEQVDNDSIFDWENNSIDELLLPSKDYPYENLKQIIFDYEKGQPINPVKKIDDFTFIAKYPVNSPIQTELIGENYIDVDVKWLQYIIEVFYKSWQHNMFKYGSMDIQTAINTMLEYIRIYVEFNVPYTIQKQCERVYNLIRWYGESIMLKYSKYIIHVEYEDWKSNLHTGKLDCDNYIENLVITDKHILQNENDNAILEIRNYICIDTYINFNIFLKGKADIYINNELVGELETGCSSKQVYNVKQGELSFKIVFKGEIIKIGNIVIDNAIVKNIYTEYKYDNGKGNFGINQVLESVKKYYELTSENIDDFAKAKDGIIGLNDLTNKLLEYMELHHKNKQKGKRKTINKGV